MSNLVLMKSPNINNIRCTRETHLSPQVKKRTLIVCLIALTIGNMMIQNVAAFMPPFIKNHDWIESNSTLITTFDVSLIISVFSVAQIIFAPFNSAIKNKLGSKNAVLVGFTLLTLSTFGLGAIANMRDPKQFKYLAITLRFIQGQGDIMVQITCYTLITQMYVEDVKNVIRYIEMCAGLGLGAGPFLGASVYQSLQYQGTIYLFALLNLIALVLCLIYIPAQLNGKNSDTQDQNQNGESLIIKETISRCQVLSNRHSIFALLSCFFGTWAIIDYVGFIASELLVQYKMADNVVGYMFASQCACYLMMCLIYPYFTDYIPRKLQFVIAMIGMGCCHLLMGPSQLLNIPQNVGIVITGMTCIGVFQVFIFIPIIPEMIERLQVSLKVSEQDLNLYGSLNDKVNDAYGFVYALTNFIAPLTASYIQQSTSMRTKFDITAITFFGFALILTVFNLGVSFIQENKQFLKDFAEYQTKEEEQEYDYDTDNTNKIGEENDENWTLKDQLVHKGKCFNQKSDNYLNQN